MVVRVILLLLLMPFCLFAQEESLALSDLDPHNLNMDFNIYDQNTALFFIQLSNLVYLEKGDVDAKVNLLRLMYPEQDIRYEYIKENIEFYPLSPNKIEILNSTRGRGAPNTTRRKKSDIELMFFGTKEFAVIVYRGSDSFQDWKTNFRIKKKSLIESTEGKKHYRNLPSGHKGYRDALKNLMDNQHLFMKLHKFVAKYTDNVADFPIYTTGHSLGGGLAILSIKPLQYNNEFNYSGTYTFAPALAVACQDAYLFDDVKDKIFNIINYADIVTRKNYSILTHIGHYYRFSKYDRFKHPQDDGLLYHKENQSQPIKFTLKERLRFFKTVMKYHKLDRYIERIKLPSNSTALVQKRIIFQALKEGIESSPPAK